LRIIAGEKPQVAAEILEIAKDISKVILKGVRRLRDEGGHDWLDAAPPIQE
jgi:hypothetical protein